MEEQEKKTFFSTGGEFGALSMFLFLFSAFCVVIKMVLHFSISEEYADTEVIRNALLATLIISSVLDFIVIGVAMALVSVGKKKDLMFYNLGITPKFAQRYGAIGMIGFFSVFLSVFVLVVSAVLEILAYPAIGFMAIESSKILVAKIIGVVGEVIGAMFLYMDYKLSIK